MLGGDKMKYLTVKEIAEKWGYSESTIYKWCREGKIKSITTAEKKNGHWQIPSNAECPGKIKARAD